MEIRGEDKISAVDNDKCRSEDDFLKGQYRRGLQICSYELRFPDDIDPAAIDPGMALFRRMQEEHLPIPAILEFHTIKAHIAPEHWERLEMIWDTLKAYEEKWRKAFEYLEWVWKQAMPANTCAQDIHTQFVNVLSLDHQSFSPPLTEDILKTMEKAGREHYYRVHRVFLRLKLWYLAALLGQITRSSIIDNEEEREPSSTSIDHVLPLNHNLRDLIETKLFYVKIINLVFATATLAKGKHHNQKTGRIREDEPKAYVEHPWATMGLYLMNLPYILEKAQQNGHDPIACMAAHGCHDVVEDGKGVSLCDMVESAVTRICDESDTVLESVVGDPWRNAGLVFAQDIYLFKYNKIRQKKLKRQLRISSKNTKLRPKEAQLACQQNIAGTATAEVVKAMGGDFIACDSPDAPCQTFQFYEADPQSAMVVFLVRLVALSHPSTFHDPDLSPQEARDVYYSGLLGKIHDRLQNLETVHNKKDKPSKDGKSTKFAWKTKRKILRDSFYLISWCVLDHDREEHPLGISLLNLIDSTILQYQRFKNQHTENIEAKDENFVTQLQTWRSHIAEEEL